MKLIDDSNSNPKKQEIEQSNSLDSSKSSTATDSKESTLETTNKPAEISSEKENFNQSSEANKSSSSVEDSASDSNDSLKTSEKSIEDELKEQQEQRKKETSTRRILWRKTRMNVGTQATANKFKLIEVKRITKVTKGGRRFRFFAVGLAGNEKGRIGIGFGKGNEVALARSKAFAQAEKKMISIPIVNDTIPHEISAKFCSSNVFFKPASAGSGLVIGGASRDVITLLGIKNIRGKSLGSNNKMNLVQATLKALKKLRTKEEWRSLRYPSPSNQ